MCSCIEAVEKRGSFYNKFLSLLEVQLLEMPEDTFADILLENNFVYNKLRDLFKSIVLCEVNVSLTMKMKQLENKLNAKYGWNFKDLTEEDEEDAPVIVAIE